MQLIPSFATQYRLVPELIAFLRGNSNEMAKTSKISRKNGTHKINAFLAVHRNIY